MRWMRKHHSQSCSEDVLILHARAGYWCSIYYETERDLTIDSEIRVMLNSEQGTLILRGDANGILNLLSSITASVYSLLMQNDMLDQLVLIHSTDRSGGNDNGTDTAA